MTVCPNSSFPNIIYIYVQDIANIAFIGLPHATCTNQALESIIRAWTLRFSLLMYNRSILLVHFVILREWKRGESRGMIRGKEEEWHILISNAPRGFNELTDWLSEWQSDGSPYSSNPLCCFIMYSDWI